MTTPALPAGLAEIADRYDALLCDVWGVIHNGQTAFRGAGAALQAFAETRGPVVLISNAARPSAEVHAQLDGYGVSRKAWSAFVSSGDATRPLLAARAPGPVWSIGPERIGPLYQGLGLEFTGPDSAAFISCTGPEDDERETPEDYRERLARCAERGLEMICVNPDLVVQRGDRLIYCGGALAQLYVELGGAVVMAGKPHAPIYRLALAEAEHLLGRPLARERVLCVGDGIATDVRGAANQGLDCLFIANGIHGAEAIRDGRLDPDATAAMLAREGLMAAYAMLELRP